MEAKEAHYILLYFSRLMTAEEAAAKRYRSYMLKIGKPEEYERPSQYDKRVSFFSTRNPLAFSKEAQDLLKDGYEAFVLKTAQRIATEHPDQYSINRCEKCNAIARTPYARQCANCGHKWHEKVAGEFQLHAILTQSYSPYIWLVAEITRGGIDVGNFVDLSNFQLNIIAEIGQMSMIRGSEEDSKNRLGLGLKGINPQERALIERYLKPPVRHIQVLKNEKHHNR